MILWLNYDSRVCHRYMPDGHVRRIQYLYFFFFFLIIKSHSNLGFVKNHKLLCLAIRVPPAQGLSALPDKNTIAAEWRFWSWPFMTGLESFEIGPRPGAVIFIEQNGCSTSGSLSWGDTFTKQQIVLSVWRKRNPSSLGVSNEAMEGVAGGDACQVMRIMEKDKP